MSPRRLLRALEKKKLTIAVAESFTGGKLQDMLTNPPGSSAVFVGGIVAYDNDVKEKLLGVPRSLLRKHGAVSAEVALSMARGVRRRLHADIGISTTGIAGPGGATPTKPRGLSYVGIATSKKWVAERRVLQGSRLLVKDRGAKQALKLLEKTVLPKPQKRRPVSRGT